MLANRLFPSLTALALLLFVTGCLPTPSRTPHQPVPQTPRAAEFGINAQESVPAAGVKSLEIRSGTGLLKVVTDPQATEIRAEGRIWSRANSLDEAERIAKEARLEIDARETENPAIIVTDPHLGAEADEYLMDLTVTIPASLRLVIKDGAGNIDISGVTGGLQLWNTSGDIEIFGVKGGVEVTHQGTRCVIQECSGLIQVFDGDGDLLISECTGEVRVKDTRGKLFIAYISGNVKAESNPEGIEVVNVDGKVHLIDIPAERSVLRGPTEIQFSSSREGAGEPSPK